MIVHKFRVNIQEIVSEATCFNSVRSILRRGKSGVFTSNFHFFDELFRVQRHMGLTLGYVPCVNGHVIVQELLHDKWTKVYEQQKHEDNMEISNVVDLKT